VTIAAGVGVGVGVGVGGGGGVGLRFGTARLVLTGRWALIGRWSLRTTIGLTAGGDAEEPERELLGDVIDVPLVPGRGAIGIADSRTLLYAGYPSQRLPERTQLLPTFS
jgi:hypothetical protein